MSAPVPHRGIPVDDVEGHRLATNDNETIVTDDDADEPDVAGHRMGANDNETIVIDEDD